MWDFGVFQVSDAELMNQKGNKLPFLDANGVERIKNCFLGEVYLSRGQEFFNHSERKDSDLRDTHEWIESLRDESKDIFSD